MIERNFWFRTAMVVIAFSAIIFVVDTVRRVWDFLGDLILVLFLAYLVGSLIIHTVRWLMRIPGMKRPLAILIVYLALGAVVSVIGALVIPATITQIIDLAEVIPDYVDRIPEFITAAEEYLAGFDIRVDLTTLLQIDQLGSIAANLQESITSNAIGLLGNVVFVIFAISLITVISFYVVLDGGRRLNAERETRYGLGVIDETFRSYLRGMVLISLIYGVGTASVMFATGLPAALPVALISSLLLAVPFVGDWLALALPLLIAALSGDFVKLLTVLLVLLFIQQVMLNILSPRILGSAVRMPAMLVVVAVVLGARLAGITGALLGVPTMGVIYTLAVHYGMVIRTRREAEEQRRILENREASTRAAESRAIAEEEALAALEAMAAAEALAELEAAQANEESAFPEPPEPELPQEPEEEPEPVPDEDPVAAAEEPAPEAADEPSGDETRSEDDPLQQGASR
ncbi:MAG: AI-2E family transporter [Chloroflexi bacterium]|nr:AI-2E family transporter [Chloroflexota bacterium]